jgi:hypothetical protein
MVEEQDAGPTGKIQRIVYARHDSEARCRFDRSVPIGLRKHRKHIDILCQPRTAE